MSAPGYFCTRISTRSLFSAAVGAAIHVDECMRVLLIFAALRAFARLAFAVLRLVAVVGDDLLLFFELMTGRRWICRVAVAVGDARIPRRCRFRRAEVERCDSSLLDRSHILKLLDDHAGDRS